MNGNQPESINHKPLQLIIPEVCAGCGIKIHAIKKKYGGWIMVNLPIPGIALFGCPKCSGVMVNINAMGNIKRIQKEQKKRIQKTPIPLFGPDGQNLIGHS